MTSCRENIDWRSGSKQESEPWVPLDTVFRGFKFMVMSLDDSLRAEDSLLDCLPCLLEWGACPPAVSRSESGKFIESSSLITEKVESEGRGDM